MYIGGKWESWGTGFCLAASPLPFGACTSRLNFGNLTRGSEGIKKEQTTDVYKKAGDKWAVSVLMGKLQLLSNLEPQCAYYVQHKGRS